MGLLKSVAREVVFPVTISLHLERLFSFLSRHNRLILCYHGVVDTPQHNVSLGPIATRQFEQHLAYFKDNFDVVSQDVIFDMYRSDFIPKRKTVALTFDDGYENNYTVAYPLLRKFNFPATMYIISQCLQEDNSITWYDFIDLMRHDIDIKKIDTNVIGRPTPNDINDLRRLIKTLNISQRKMLFAEISKQIKIENYATQLNRPHWKLMNAQQLNELSLSGLIEIGAHTRNHPNLGEIKLEDAVMEVKNCKKDIENALQKEIYSIAFPDGSYNDDVKAICIKEGFKNLLAVDYKCESDYNDKSILPRAGVSSTTTYHANMIHINMAFKTFGF